MFVVTLRFADNKAEAGRHIDGHSAWLRQGFDDGVLLLAGGLQPDAGGALLAHGVSAEELRHRVGADPFVAHGVVVAEILEIAPGMTDPRLDFLRIRD